MRIIPFWNVHALCFMVIFTSLMASYARLMFAFLSCLVSVVCPIDERGVTAGVFSEFPLVLLKMNQHCWTLFLLFPLFVSGVANPRDPLPCRGKKFSSCLHGPHYSPHPYRGWCFQSFHPWGGRYTHVTSQLLMVPACGNSSLFLVFSAAVPYFCPSPSHRYWRTSHGTQRDH